MLLTAVAEMGVDPATRWLWVWRSALCYHAHDTYQKSAPKTCTRKPVP